MLLELTARLPDLPRWVETRGMLLSGRCDPIVPLAIFQPEAAA
ncbi:MAG TPA: hypothetical protein VMR54_13275 [Thermoanaerobaculia bacterium]|nr:hypothetical protein [Thermoanaerobaculia bacterium]